MKKFLTSFLFVCSCALLTGAAIGCDKNPPSSESSTSSSNSSSSSSSSSSTVAKRTVTFSEGEGYEVEHNLPKSGKADEGSVLTFRVELGAFYAGNVIAYVNEEPLLANNEGYFSVEVGGEDLDIRIQGVEKDRSQMTGTGSMQDAFVVTRPIDLLYIAERVNAGDPTYCGGAYILANDIDCKGEELAVIGDYSSERAVFNGTFSCASDPDTGVIQRHTISNFVINANDCNYVGLFGAVIADMTLESAPLFFGICLDDFQINVSPYGLEGENKSISCGGLVGYGVGVNFFLCDATNGEINVASHDSYFSFVGGLIGYQQGFFNTDYGLNFPSEISYSKVDVDVNISAGVSLYAGGISGFAVTNYPFGAVASVHNSYAHGNVNGALRSGGIVGGLGRYTSVSNCYATGNIVARAHQSPTKPGAVAEYCHAYAGGLVGYAENDTIAHDSFFNGTVDVDAVAGIEFEHTDAAIGGGDAPMASGANAVAYIVENCLFDVDLSNKAFLTDKLGWQKYDWVFTSDELPTINYASAEGTVNLYFTFKYVAPDSDTEILVNKLSETAPIRYFTSEISSSTYSPIGSFFASGSLAQYHQADNSAYRSYGYFFDEECTRKVPYSYVPMKDVTLYIGFADPTAVCGSYDLLLENSAEKATLVVSEEGYATYSDGASSLDTYYTYDGKYLILEAARLARYFTGEITVDETDTTIYQDENFDLYRYDFYSFAGELNAQGELCLFDGKYFTKDAPLKARADVFRGEYYVREGDSITSYIFYGDTATTGGNVYNVAIAQNVVTLTKEGSPSITLQKDALTPYDAFKGSWVKSSTIQKSYAFDGTAVAGGAAGNWEYVYTTYERSLDELTLTVKCTPVPNESASGKYTVDANGDAYFTHEGVDYKASFDKDGYLTVAPVADETQTQRFAADGGLKGVWKGSDFTLTLNGIREDGFGFASMRTDDGYETKLVYEYLKSNGVIALYTILEGELSTKDSFYGYATYALNENTLTFVLPNANAETGFGAATLLLYDDYYGDWISEHDTLTGVTLSFNGLGLYTYLGNTSNIKGEVTILDGNEKTTVPYDLKTGTFAYDGVTYVLAYDENKEEVAVKVANVDGKPLLRKDEFAGVTLVDMAGNVFDMDGRSTLQSGGKFTYNQTQYAYYYNGDGTYAVKTLNGDDAGSIVKKTIKTETQTDSFYLLTMGTEETKLYLSNKFMGDWAISGKYALFKIGPTNLDGVIKATFKGKPVELTYLDPTTLTFYYREDKMPYTYYVFVQTDEKTGENELVVSEFTNLFGEYFICTKADELFGTWVKKSDEKMHVVFDGVSSKFVNGSAELVLTLQYSVLKTEYYYSIREKGITFWTRSPLAGKTLYFSLKFLDESEWATAGDDAFVLYDEKGDVKRMFVRSEVDGLYLTEASDKKNNYFFDGLGNMRLNDEKGEIVYTYKILSYNPDKTASLEVVDKATNVKYEATLDYKDNAKIKFILGEEVVENADDDEQPAA